MINIQEIENKYFEPIVKHIIKSIAEYNVMDFVEQYCFTYGIDTIDGQYNGIIIIYGVEPFRVRISSIAKNNGYAREGNIISCTYKSITKNYFIPKLQADVLWSYGIIIYNSSKDGNE